MKKIYSTALILSLMAFAGTSFAQNTTQSGTVSGVKKELYNKGFDATKFSNNSTVWNTWSPRTNGAVGDLVFTGRVELLASPSTVFISPIIRTDTIQPSTTTTVTVPSVTGTTLTYNIGNITTLNSTTINNSGKITTGQLEVNSAQINTITGNSLTYNTGVFSTLTSGTANISGLLQAGQLVVNNDAEIKGNLVVRNYGMFDKDVRASGYYHNSDENVKNNMQQITPERLKDIEKLTGYTYTLKMDGKPSIGVKAQDVEKVYPELVKTFDGIKSVNYDGLVGVLIEANNEKTKKIEEQDNKIKELENRLLKLEEKLQ